MNHRGRERRQPHELSRGSERERCRNARPCGLRALDHKLSRAKSDAFAACAFGRDRQFGKVRPRCEPSERHRVHGLLDPLGEDRRQRTGDRRDRRSPRRGSDFERRHQTRERHRRGQVSNLARHHRDFGGCVTRAIREQRTERRGRGNLIGGRGVAVVVLAVAEDLGGAEVHAGIEVVTVNPFGITIAIGIDGWGRHQTAVDRDGDRAQSEPRRRIAETERHGTLARLPIARERDVEARLLAWQDACPQRRCDARRDSLGDRFRREAHVAWSREPARGVDNLANRITQHRGPEVVAETEHRDPRDAVRIQRACQLGDRGGKQRGIVAAEARVRFDRERGPDQPEQSDAPIEHRRKCLGNGRRPAGRDRLRDGVGRDGERVAHETEAAALSEGRVVNARERPR